jgi:catechol 2,3-dioxygenase-like lactoylglutathione lyase family enzyme
MTCELDPMAVYGIEHGLRITDPEKMLAFYCGALGFEPFAEIFIPGGHVWGLRFGNAMLKMMYLEELPSAPEEARLLTHYVTIHVLNAEQMQKRAVDGGATLLEPFSTFTPSRDGDPECGYVLFRDPEGNVVEFSQGSPWVAATEEFRSRAARGWQA